MIDDNKRQFIGELLARSFNEKVDALSFKAVGGGSVNQTFQVLFNGDRNFFCKVNSASKYPGFFLAEKKGLELIAKQNSIRTPVVIAFEESSDFQVLILEWIEPGARTPAFWCSFGQQLASLHCVSAEAENVKTVFGLGHDNYMGALVQSNKPSENWVDFFTERRLVPQIELARRNNLLSASEVKLFSGLFKRLVDIFPSSSPSLLHGDLWSGNLCCDEAGRPVLIDPAVYFGDRIIDLAMTRLFGGFDELFYQAYAEQFPLAENFLVQCDVCNLYPLLIHLNLFGRSYRAPILETIGQFQ
jgi:protein-ribulosamine 3-kinase